MIVSVEDDYVDHVDQARSSPARSHAAYSDSLKQYRDLRKGYLALEQALARDGVIPLDDLVAFHARVDEALRDAHAPKHRFYLHQWSVQVAFYARTVHGIRDMSSTQSPGVASSGYRATRD